jgi:hypothetical protein
MPCQVNAIKRVLNRNLSQEQFLSTLFSNRWRQNDKWYIKSYTVISEGRVSNASAVNQAETNFNWLETCNRLEHIKILTLVFTDTDYTNSLIIAKNKQGGWLIQINVEGEGLMFKGSKIIGLFLSISS